jgi:hypothetical protein
MGNGRRGACADKKRLPVNRYAAAQAVSPGIIETAWNFDSEGRGLWGGRGFFKPNSSPSDHLMAIAVTVSVQGVPS